MASVLTQDHQSASTTSAGFNNTGDGRVVSTFRCLGTNLSSAIVELLGDTKPKGDGRLERTMPMAHPQYPWMYCDKILTLRGVGGGVYTVGSVDQFIEVVPTLDTFAVYPQYEIVAEFTTRPYVLLRDPSISVEMLTYYDDDDLTVDVEYADEWKRFCDFEFAPKAEYLTGLQGQMKLEASDLDPPNGYQFAAAPRIVVPGGLYRIVWHQVPYSYVYSENSYLTNFLGRVNQNDFLSFNAGELLFESFNARRYTPPLPRVITSDEVSYPSAEKLCVIEMNFSFTRRTAKRAAPTPTNNSFIAAGHNLLPWLGNTGGEKRGFYYATGPDDHPTYPSAPYELLFTDPDV